jgi:hypothetical protein
MSAEKLRTDEPLKLASATALERGQKKNTQGTHKRPQFADAK